jgi:DsbC/DsbD-like thiol-disulfide interchange protein
MHGVMRDAMLWLFVLALVQSAPLLPPPAPPKHLTIAATASAAAVAAGSTIDLFLDITPNPGIHVYAPGARDYVPISVRIDRTDGITARATAYPKSDTMTFAGERVPVFHKRFRLVDQVTIAPTTKPGTTVTITGTVSYQACDDKVCFIPASAPVTWTVRVKGKS